LYSSTAWHPSIKPASVCKKLIKVNTLEGEIVLDPFMGSGTTGVAAVALSRKFIGMEIDPTYFKMAEKRIMETKKQSRLTDTETAVKPIPPTPHTSGNHDGGFAPQEPPVGSRSGRPEQKD
jgi:predicted RNA methylase